MATDKQYGPVAEQHSDSNVYEDYGAEDDGWTTPMWDVSMLEYVLLAFSYTHADSGSPASLLSLQVLFGDRAALEDGNFDDCVPEWQVGADGALSDVTLTLDVSWLSDAETINRTLRVDVRAASVIRVAAKVDDESDGPTLGMSWLGSGRSTPLTSSPEIVPNEIEA
jgi:hypothetical protein